jgi:hypothetical protein
VGLFDTVHCEYPLPDPRLAGQEFQTKDLECCLETYTITADGRLMRHARRTPTGRASLDRDVEWPIHGDILIYASDPDREQGLVDLVVRFTHGRVESIRRLEEGESPRGAPPPQPWLSLGPVAPSHESELDSWFREIVASGTGLRFEPAHNERWLLVTRPIVEAFFHARYFLEMAVRYASLEEPPRILPSGWAALLHLYGLR